jgi:hypothetical protein
MEPYSSAGMYRFQKNHALLKKAQSKHLVAFLGDSRMLEGFSVKNFCNAAANTPYAPVLLDVPGTTLRVWYYLLKQVDPDHHAFEEIAVPLVSYSNVDEWEDLNERILDVNFLAPHLSLAESMDLLNTYTDRDIKIRVMLGNVLRGYAYRSDLQGFLLHPKRRFQDLRHWKREDEHIVYDYEGRPTSLVGLLDQGGALTKGSSDISDIALERLNHRVFNRLPPQTGRQKRYNDYWLNRLVDDYSKAGTKLVIFRIPTDPVVRKIAIPNECSTTTRLSHQKNIFVLPQNLFRDLEAPQYFSDDMHMNGVGRTKFTDRLTSAVLGTLDCRHQQ